MRGINATKVLNADKQVDLINQSLYFSVVCRTQDWRQTSSTLLHVLRSRQSHDFPEAEKWFEELEASTHEGELDRD